MENNYSVFMKDDEDDDSEIVVETFIGQFLSIKEVENFIHNPENFNYYRVVYRVINNFSKEVIFWRVNYHPKGMLDLLYINLKGYNKKVAIDIIKPVNEDEERELRTKKLVHVKFLEDADIPSDIVKKNSTRYVDIRSVKTNVPSSWDVEIIPFKPIVKVDYTKGKFLLFGGKYFYPKGGWNDFIAAFTTIDLVQNYIENYLADEYTEKEDGWCEIIDLEIGEEIKNERTVE